ncbi:MAG: CotH kinase family protein [Flavobacteriales bacterium]|nr:CotH kinase family protein [Flavobacteriales bacterium]
MSRGWFKYLIYLPLWLLTISAWSQDDLYAPGHLTEIRLTFAEDNWDALLDALYLAGEDGRLEATIEIDGVVLNQVGVRYKGFSSVSVDQEKNPFNIKLDYIVAGQSYQGRDKLKLANVIHDPSFLREVLSYEVARQYMPAGMANFAKLFINDEYWGLYTNVEAVEKEFLVNHFPDPDGSFFKCNPEQLDLFGENSNLSNTPGSAEANYYELYTLESETGWTDLLDLIDVLNDDAQNVESVLNVDRALWMHAFNYGLINYDSYIGFAQNYYLYHDHNGQWNTIPWDLNMSFGSFRLTDASDYYDGFTIEQAKTMDPLAHYNSFSAFPRPLLRNLFEDDHYRKMFLAHLRTITTENFENQSYIDRAEYYRAIIDTAVADDPNKFYSDEDFDANLNETVEDLADYPGLTELMEPRAAWLLDYEGISNPPVIDSVWSTVGTLTAGGNAGFFAQTSNAASAWFYYRYGGSDVFSSAVMIDEGNGLFSVDLTNTGNAMDYYVYTENETDGRFAPERAAYEFYHLHGELGSENSVVINEFMAFNSAVVADGTGDYDDWLELYNNASYTVSTSGLFLTDDPLNLTKWAMPDVSIAPDGYAIFWLDEQGSEGALHTNFQLSQLGEYLAISDSAGTIIDEVTFDAATENLSYSRFPNGTGDFIEMTPTFAAENAPVSVEQMAPMEFKIYPNPANDQLWIARDGVGAIQIEIRNSVGELCASQSDRGGLVLLAINHLPNGYYTLTLSDKTRSTSQKLLIIH